MIKINSKGSYFGIDSYKKNSKSKKKKRKKSNIRKSNRGNKKTVRSVFFIVLLSIVVSILGIKNLTTKSLMKLSDESVTYYINETDRACEDKLQLNWKEIAAIDLVFNDGQENLNSGNEVINIADMFFKFDKDKNVLGIKTFREVINEVGLSNKEKEKAYKYLERIENNYLNRKLVNDKNKYNFINKIGVEAKSNYKEYGILPSITIAQAILESGWGESTLATEHNNLFGIKADERWDGKKVSLETKENYNDIINDYFREYSNYEDSVKDHGKFLSENVRYKESGIFNRKTYKGQAESLENAGYATVKNEDGELIYAELLINVIQKNNLMLYDTEVQR